MTGRHHIDEAFNEAGLKPDIVISALDSDVIKTYVELGLGVGILASMSFNPQRDTGLVLLNASTLLNRTLPKLQYGMGIICGAMLIVL